MAKEKEWIVECTITGQAVLFITAKSEEEAIEKANKGDWHDSELNHWEADEPLKAELNE